MGLDHGSNDSRCMAAAKFVRDSNVPHSLPSILGGGKSDFSKSWVFSTEQLYSTDSSQDFTQEDKFEDIEAAVAQLAAADPAFEPRDIKEVFANAKALRREVKTAGRNWKTGLMAGLHTDATVALLPVLCTGQCVILLSSACSLRTHTFSCKVALHLTKPALLLCLTDK